jgi:DNA-binding NarL/FixJ family response regulator
MASPISDMNMLGGELFGKTGAVQPEAAAKARAPEPKSAMMRPEEDTVTLSLSAKAQHLKQQGESVSEIAKRLNVDEKTLERYLAKAPESAEEQAHQMKQQGESVTQIADRLGVDIKTVNRYLGVLPLSYATQAQQLKQRGESVIEIANRLGVDVKTVKRYLGTAPGAVSVTVEK